MHLPDAACARRPRNGCLGLLLPLLRRASVEPGGAPRLLGHSLGPWAVHGARDVSSTANLATSRRRTEAHNMRERRGTQARKTTRPTRASNSGTKSELGGARAGAEETLRLHAARVQVARRQKMGRGCNVTTKKRSLGNVHISCQITSCTATRYGADRRPDLTDFKGSASSSNRRRATRPTTCRYPEETSPADRPMCV